MYGPLCGPHGLRTVVHRQAGGVGCGLAVGVGDRDDVFAFVVAGSRKEKQIGAVLAGEFGGSTPARSTCPCLTLSGMILTRWQDYVPRGPYLHPDDFSISEEWIMSHAPASSFETSATHSAKCLRTKASREFPAYWASELDRRCGPDWRAKSPGRDPIAEFLSHQGVCCRVV